MFAWKITILATVLVLIASVSAVHIGTDPGAATGNGIDAAGTAPTSIDSCTTIDEPGRYVLTENVSGYGGGYCITIESSDVVLDGNGHTIDASETNGVLVNGSEGAENVTIRDLRVHGLIAASAGTFGVIVENASDTTVANVTVEDAFVGVEVHESSDVTIRNVTAEGEESTHGSSFFGVGSLNSENVTIADSTVGTFSVKIMADGQNITVRNNTIDHDFMLSPVSDTVAIQVSASQSTIHGNEIRSGDNSWGHGITLSGNATGTHITENTISITGDSGIRVNTTGTSDASNVIANNTIESAEVGVYVVENSIPLDIEYNEFPNTKKGIRINHRASCYGIGEGADVVSVHWNSFEGTRVGINNLDDGVVNATNNYWGASNGPASANDTDAPFEDPETGTLADGDGSAVSEHPNEPGVSNVHFDTWLDEPPAEAGASTNETATS